MAGNRVIIGIEEVGGKEEQKWFKSGQDQLRGW